MYTSTNSNSHVLGNQYIFKGHGKLLLTGEYFVLDGAKALGIPLKLGQTLKVRYEKSFHPFLEWKSYDSTGSVWFEGSFEFWHFNCLDQEITQQHLFIQQLLRAARSLNSHFMREENYKVIVETHLDFPINWGLGSSSTLIYTLASWAYVGPFELLFKTIGGSGYDIACAQSLGPIVYQKEKHVPQWSTANYRPLFKEQLYFVYLGEKSKSHEAIKFYKSLKISDKKFICEKISALTYEFIEAKTLTHLENIIYSHEEIISNSLEITPIKKKRFSDYWGAIKSLGAWGGDFVLVTSDRSEVETRKYFLNHGLIDFFKFDELVLNKRPYQDVILSDEIVSGASSYVQ